MLLVARLGCLEKRRRFDRTRRPADDVPIVAVHRRTLMLATAAIVIPLDLILARNLFGDLLRLINENYNTGKFS